MGRWTWRDSWEDRNSVWANRAIVHSLSLLEVAVATCEGVPVSLLFSSSLLYFLTPSTICNLLSLFFF